MSLHIWAAETHFIRAKILIQQCGVEAQSDPTSLQIYNADLKMRYKRLLNDQFPTSVVHVDFSVYLFDS